jgi:thymidylate kinase
MRIAVSGTHRAGKTTLVEALSRNLPTHESLDEPYYLLEEEGYEFAERPSIEDFETQLSCSLECIQRSSNKVIFDRCPLDILAYLLTHRDADAFDLENWLPLVRNAMEHIDLVVFIPIEVPDRIAVSTSDGSRLRRRVDREIREILVEDRWDFGVNVLEVNGSLSERLRQTLVTLTRGVRVR